AVVSWPHSGCWQPRVKEPLVNWDFLLNEGAVASVLPGDYARWRQPIRGALVYFLAGLPPERQAAILAAQATLPANATWPKGWPCWRGVARRCTSWDRSWPATGTSLPS